MCKILVVVTMWFATFVGVYAEIKSFCGNGSESELNLIKSNDGIGGRYNVQWCSHGDRNVTKWHIELRYLTDKRTQDNCVVYDVYDVHPNSLIHSQVEDTIHYNISCPILCLWRQLDLLFDGCYALKSRLKINKLFQHADTMHYIHNNLTKDDFRNSTELIHTSGKTYDDNELVVTWYTGLIPLTEFAVTLYRLDNATEIERNITDSCSKRSWNQLVCSIWAQPGVYREMLEMTAPWAHNRLFKTFYAYDITHGVNATDLGVSSVNGSGTTILACALVASVCVCAVVAVSLRVKRGRRTVLQDWTKHRQELESALKPPEPADIQVVLLYARAGGAAPAVAKLLKELLLSTGTKVWDIHSPSTAAAWGAAPAQALRGALAQPRNKVVLLLTPQLTVQPGELAPSFGDALLQYALRAIADAPLAEHPYKKLFLATLPLPSDQPTDPHTLSHLVPFTRYPLHGGAEVLLRHLGLRAEPSALRRFREHVARVAAG